MVIFNLEMNTSCGNILKEKVTDFVKREMEIKSKMKIGKSICFVEIENMEEKIEIHKGKRALRTTRKIILINKGIKPKIKGKKNRRVNLF